MEAVPCASRIDCTDTLRAVFSGTGVLGATPGAEESDAAVDGAAGDGGDFHTFWTGFFCPSAGEGTGRVSPAWGTGRDGPELRRAHSQAPSTPIATPNSTLTIVDQLEAGAAAGTTAPGAATVSAGARVVGALAAGSLAANAALADTRTLPPLSFAKPTVSAAFNLGTAVPAGGCAHAARLPLSSPSSKSSSNSRLPLRGQPAGLSRLTEPAM
ncbi:hypothetical protein ACVWYF_002120 [Hymenobacter sp. UYAg731]